MGAAQLRVLDFSAKLEQKKRYARSKTGYTSTGKRVARAADPIPPHELARIKAYFLGTKATRYGLRNWMIVLLGINIGCRCGDLCKLRLCDIIERNEIKTCVEYTAEKTRSSEVFYLQDSIKHELVKYIETLPDKSPGAFLFQGERGGGLTTGAVRKLFTKAAKDLNLDFHFSAHSLRKSYGRKAYEVYGMDGARELLRHRDNKSTAHYIGVKEEHIKEKALSLPNLGL